MTNHSTTLILHPDASRRQALAVALERRGFACRHASDRSALVEHGEACDFDFVIQQVSAGACESIESEISQARAVWSNSRVIALVPAGDTSVIREAFRAGAWDCLEEPVSTDTVADCIAQARNADSKHANPTPSEPPMGERASTAHGAFLDSLAHLRCLCRRHSEPLSVMMIDIDRFRELNERYSPALGDRVLKWFGSLLQGVCRGSDLVARDRGDRSIVALPDSTATDAVELGRRCRAALVARPLAVGGRNLEITVSIGIAESTVGFIETEHQLLRRARLALEQAKARGSGGCATWNEVLAAQPSRRELQNLSVQEVSHWVERLRQHLRSTYVESTRALVAAVEAKDPYTQAHSLAVAGYAEAIGKRMNLSPRMIETLGVASMLHDVGKIGVPDAILSKAEPLTAEEFNIIKRHPETALEIIAHVSFLSEERPLILHHHERFDGTGYPAGLKGDCIPIGARILAAADALDTMFSPRAYKKPYSIDQVRSELLGGTGRQFDLAVVDATIQWMDASPEDFPLYGRDAHLRHPTTRRRPVLERQDLIAQS